MNGVKKSCAKPSVNIDWIISEHCGIQSDEETMKEREKEIEDRERKLQEDKRKFLEEKEALVKRKRKLSEMKKAAESALHGEKATEASVTGENESKKTKLSTQNDDEDGLKRLEAAEQSMMLPKGLVRQDSSVKVKCDRKGCTTCVHVSEPFLHFVRSWGKEHGKVGECHLCQLYRKDDLFCSLVGVERAKLKSQKDKQ